MTGQDSVSSGRSSTASLPASGQVRSGQVRSGQCGGWTDLDSVELGVGPQVGAERTGETGGAEGQETANI